MHRVNQPADKTKSLLATTIIRRLQKIYPQARCALYYRTPYQLLVSVVLSAQANDKIVNRCMAEHYDHGFNVETVLAWGYQTLLHQIRQIGLAPTKARNIISLTKILQNQHDGNVPNNRQHLEALPGVGRKTANVVLAELFGQKTLAVDTHVFRTTKRLGLHNEKEATKCEQVLLTVISKRYLPQAHHLLIAHGRQVCHARKPACDVCQLNDLCFYVKDRRHAC